MLPASASTCACATPTCTLHRHPRLTLRPPALCGKGCQFDWATGVCRVEDCVRQSQLGHVRRLEATSADACEAACLQSPWCDAAVFFGPQFATPSLRSTCHGRTAGGLVPFEPLLDDGSVGFIRVCDSGCNLQARLDAYCAANCSGVARNLRALANTTRSAVAREDFEWVCVPEVGERTLALACVDDRGHMAPCWTRWAGAPSCGAPLRPTASRAARGRQRVAIAVSSEALHDLHRGRADGRCLPPCAAPPPTAPADRIRAATPPRAWTPRADGAAALDALAAAGYTNCSAQLDEAGQRGACTDRARAAHRLSWAWEGSDAFDAAAFVERVSRLRGNASAGRVRDREVIFAGDSTARQQAASLCCLLRAGFIGSPETEVRLAITGGANGHGPFRCHVERRDGSGGGGRRKRRTLLTVSFERLGGVQHACRADASARDRPQELNPHINLFLGRAIARAPPVLVVNLGAWEYEDGCADSHSRHDGLCRGERPWVYSDYLARWRMVGAAIEAAYPPPLRAASLVVARTSTPRDFAPGPWYEGGTCAATAPADAATLATEEQTAEASRGGVAAAAARPISMRFATLSQVLLAAAALAERHPWVRVLDAYEISRQRVETHPGKYGPRGIWDCLHWCLPGVPDVFNGELLRLLRGGGDADGPAAVLARWRGAQYGGGAFVDGESTAALALRLSPGAPPTRLACLA